MLSFSLHRAPPQAGNEAPGAPQPPPHQEGALPQGAWPLDGTHSVRRQHSKRRAAMKSLIPKKLPMCSPHWPVTTALLLQRAKTPRCSWRQRAKTSKIKPFVTKGLLWPVRAVVPSPPSCAA